MLQGFFLIKSLYFTTKMGRDEIKKRKKRTLFKFSLEMETDLLLKNDTVFMLFFCFFFVVVVVFCFF